MGKATTPVVVAGMLKELGESEVLEPDLVRGIKDVCSICSSAIHGRKVSESQVAFVKDLGPQLIATITAMTSVD